MTITLIIVGIVLLILAFLSWVKGVPLKEDNIKELTRLFEEFNLSKTKPEIDAEVLNRKNKNSVLTFTGVLKEKTGINSIAIAGGTMWIIYFSSGKRGHIYLDGKLLETKKKFLESMVVLLEAKKNEDKLKESGPDAV